MVDWGGLTTYVPLLISLVSLVVSLGTFWLAYLHRGRLRMTKPVVVFFGFDMESRPVPKVFLRMLLYSTAARGHVVEALHVRLGHDGDKSTFSFWGCGETTNLSAGAGLHVSRAGFAANHHFLLPFHDRPYRFSAGRYEIDVIANVVGSRKPVRLMKIDVDLTGELAAALGRNEGVLFERSVTGDYVGHRRD